MSVKVLVAGANGQLGRALLAAIPDSIQVRGVSRQELDVTDLSAVQAMIESWRPEVIINAAAYTAVDKAESEPDAAEQGNVTAPRNLALAARTGAARLIHVSTDFVFDGRGCSAYTPDSVTIPLGVYGRTKLAGEQVVQQVLGARALTVRTAWVYDATGKNFLRTMLRLMQERGAVKVVADQIGTPTSAASLAGVIWQFAARADLSGVYHWSDAGVASWYDFAVAIAEEAVATGILKNMPIITPIATAEYPTPAQRPAFSVLDKSATYAALGLKPAHWRQELRKVMQELM
ncbi:MAG: dTDP-4-dehydrorhamnose reductase [Steroidobacteraceae bacterium]